MHIPCQCRKASVSTNAYAFSSVVAVRLPGMKRIPRLSGSPSADADVCLPGPARRRPSRMVLADEAKAPVSRYVGKPPPERRGRLRLDFARYAQPDANPQKPVPLNAAEYRWSSGGYNKVTRSLEVWTFVERLLFSNWLDNKSWSYWMFKMTEQQKRARRRKLAAFARETILNFGPTFIKVGQLASARADLFPAEVIEELSELQDRVPGFTWRAAEEILRQQYAKPVEDVFAYFDKEPIAAASLGQVHRAGLPTGEDVVVKIQRPGLKELFDLDLDALRAVAMYLENSKQYSGNGRDWVGIYEECRKVLYEEIDYIREANNCERFRENFKDYQYVRIPKAYLDYTTPTVLCLQYIPGLSIRDRDGMLQAGINPKLVAERSATILLKQILDYAFFTADPHSGNIAVSPQNGGTIILYDFGMVGVLNPNIKERLIDILIGVIEKDAEVVMNTLVELGALVLPPDPLPVRRSIQYFLDNVGSRPNREQTVSAIGDDLYATAYDKPFRLPAASIFLLRSLSTLEGVNKTLYPDFRFSEVAGPFADDILQSRGRSQNPFSGRGFARSIADAALNGRGDVVTSQVQKRLLSVGTNALQAVSRIEKIEKTLGQLERGDLKVRARATETERLLRKQYAFSEASNYLTASATAALLATQMYLMLPAQSPLHVEAAWLFASLSTLMGLAYLRKAAKIKKEPFTARNKEE